MILNIILFVIILKLSRCSLVFDAATQNTVYVANYCPAMKSCKEGTHVMCMYYDQNRPVGQNCHNYVKFTITPQMVYQILEEVNYIRLKVATGKEIGKDDLPLPRAYGMMKMFWDSELATLAQVLADQCLGLKEDQCRSTEKFTNPSQVITIINFKVPNWDYLTRNTTTRGLTKEKISFAIEKALKSLHAVKKMVDPSEIYDCPAMETIPDKGSRSYLKLIRGKATHIGCGMSAYTRYQILHNGAENIYNSVQIVCNISDGPQQSQPLYTTDPPIPGTGFTEHCGCPPSYQETEGCLCEPKVEKIETRVNPHKWQPHDDDDNKIDQQSGTTPCTDPNGNCGEASKVIVLPIFHVQDYPAESYEPTNEVEAQFHHRFGNMTFLPSDSSVEKNEISDEHDEEKPKYIKVRKNNISYIQRRNMPRTKKPRKIVFKPQYNAAQTERAIIKKKVARTEKYVESFNSLEDNVFDHNIHSVRAHDYDEKMTIDDVNKDNDTTFLTLLDNLERAVKDVELEGDERELFDVKMRKIYEAALKTKVKIPTTTTETIQTIRVKKTTTHRPPTEPLIFTPDDNESDFHEVSDNLETITGHPFEDERKSFERRITEDTEKDYQQNLINDNYINEEPRHWEQKDKESDELSKIMNDKITHVFNNRENHGNFDYFSNKDSGLSQYRVDRLYEKTDDRNLPVSRKQEDIDNYYENFKENTEKSIHKFNNHHILRTRNDRPYFSKKLDSEEHTKTLEAGIKKPAFEVRQAMKFGRKTFSLPNNYVWRAPTFEYRPVFESEPERPTLPI